MKFKSALFAAAALFAQPAWAADIEVTGAFVRASPAMAGAGAGFLTIANHGAADRLLGAEASVSKAVELHTHVKDGDVYRMRAVEAIAVPAHGTVQLQPGGDHIMFIGLNEPLKEGAKVPVTLKFEKAGAVKVEMPVLGVGAMGPAMMQGQGMMPGHGPMEHGKR
ncbi:MAG: copper chaperone PCu(A)C [Magnetospirillum sp.]|nr:copper chaperone PCu(A)C [Magnetospirillum sp.]